MSLSLMEVIVTIFSQLGNLPKLASQSAKRPSSLQSVRIALQTVVLNTSQLSTACDIVSQVFFHPTLISGKAYSCWPHSAHTFRSVR